jgi:imidazolonepropionase-like amidohydrolase
MFKSSSVGDVAQSRSERSILERRSWRHCTKPDAENALQSANARMASSKIERSPLLQGVSVRIFSLVLVLLVLGLVQRPISKAASRDSQTIVLSHVRLIDGTGGPPLENASITIRGGEIVAIATGNSLKIPSDARSIDYSGKTIIPGLINTHGHLALVCGLQNSATCYTEDNVIAELRQYERYGVTSMLSLGINRDLIYEVRGLQRAGKLDGASVYSGDRGIGVPNAAPPLPHAPDQLYQPMTPAEARADVDAMASRHADMVKIWVDNLHGTKPSMDPAIYRAVIDQAHRQGLHVAAHVYYLADAKALVSDGVDVLAHSVRDQTIDQELLSAMKQRGVFYIPTLTVDESFFAYAEHPEWKNDAFLQAGMSPELLNTLTGDAQRQKVEHDSSLTLHKRDFANDQENLKLAYDAGVKVGFGTDSGAIPSRIPGFAEHHELEMMVSAGLMPMQAILCATKTNAELLGIQQTTGTLTMGKQADLIVLEGNPLDDIRNTRKMVAIWHGGREVQPVTAAK